MATSQIKVIKKLRAQGESILNIKAITLCSCLEIHKALACN